MEDDKEYESGLEGVSETLGGGGPVEVVEVAMVMWLLKVEEPISNL